MTKKWSKNSFVTEAMIPTDDRKKEEKELFDLFSVSLTVDKGGEIGISGDTEVTELERLLQK